VIAIALAAAAAATSTPLKLPADAPVIMDYLAVDGDRVWIPAGNTGKVFVLTAGRFQTIDGFATKKGRNDRLMGPSAVTIGEGAAYVGNRGDSRIWPSTRVRSRRRGPRKCPALRMECSTSPPRRRSG